MLFNQDGKNDFSPDNFSDFTGEALTVYEAKEVFRNKKFDLVNTNDIFNRMKFRGASPVGVPCITLRAGEKVRSNQFSGNGWRFSGKQYLPEYGTGAYLYWKTVGDDGRVGNFNQAYFLWLNGTLAGTPIYKNQGRVAIYCGESVPGYMYYTYYPASGSYYEVDNI